MKGRPDQKRIPELNQECERIYAQYDPDPDNAVYQHAKIGDKIARSVGEVCSDQNDDGEEMPSGDT